MPDFNTAARNLIWRSLCLLVFLLCLLQAWTVWQAPARYRPQMITLTLAPGESQILGQRELAAAQAQNRHVQISRSAEGIWQIQNLSTNKQVLLQAGPTEIALPKSINGQPGDAVVLSNPDIRGMILGRTHFKLQLQAQAQSVQSIQSIQSIQSVPSARLRIEPTRRISLFSHANPVLPSTVTWQWQQEQYWQLPLNATTGSLLLACLLLGVGQRWPRWHAVAGAAIAISAGFALFSNSMDTPALAQSLTLSWLGPMLWLSLPNSLSNSLSNSLPNTGLCKRNLPHRQNLGLALAMNLLAIGLLSQLEMGLFGMESSWLGYYHKTAALQALALGTAALAAPWVLVHTRRVPRLKTVEIVLLLLALLALVSMALEVLYGNEGGVFGFQPVELAKTALVALTAHVLALCTRQSFPRRLLVWRLLAPVAVMLAFVSLALIHVSDYSPLLLLLIWASLCGLVHTLVNGQKWAACCLLLGMACAPLAVFGLRAGWMQIPGQFYGERFSVWLEPALHPHTGYQFLLGAQAIIHGGWFGADKGFSLGDIMQIPALQDDFALAFFLNRHGMLAGMLLWSLQTGLLLGLAYRACQVWQSAHSLQDFRRVWHARFYAFVLIGGASFLFGQLLLSWSTNLGMLPVMGQPMSFLSAGGSHLLFFLLPLQSFHALYAPNLEEIPSCPPMSTTKY